MVCELRGYDAAKYANNNTELGLLIDAQPP